MSEPAAGSFEALLVRLEEIAKLLEVGELPLEESLVLFEEGVGLSARAHALLEKTEKKVELLLGGQVRPYTDTMGERHRSSPGSSAGQAP